MLNGLEGRKSGTIADYSYSEANKKAEIVWSAATFKDYIQNPMPRCPAPRWLSPASRTKPRSPILGYLAQFKADGCKKCIISLR